MSDETEWGLWVMGLIDCSPATGSIMWLYRPRELFLTDHEWKRWNTRYAHTRAFDVLGPKGYLHGTLKKRGYLAHRVVWAVATGRMPTQEIDHINGNKQDNRISNLREVDRIENCRNAARRTDNTSGKAGVTRSGNSWLARIGTGDARIVLGSFPTLSLAIEARETAEKSLGYTERHGV